MVRGIVRTVFFFFVCVQQRLEKIVVENVLDLLNKENSLLLQQGLHPRTKSLRALGGAAQRVLS